ARAPYGEHLPYAVPGDHFEVLAEWIPPHVQQWFDHANRGTYTVRDPDELRRRLAAITAQGQRRLPPIDLHGVRLYVALFESPPAPAGAPCGPHPVAMVGESRDAGPFRPELGRAPPTLFSRDDRIEPVGSDDDWTFGVAVVDGKPWLVTTR